MSKEVDRLVDWIAWAVKDAGMRGAVVGMSGGIDSAVISVLCKQALDDEMLGVIMPCGSGRADEEDALQVAARFDIKTVTVRLDEPFKAMTEVLPEVPEQVRANLKPRLRMATLYYFGNLMSYLVVGTGNRSELMTGYFTKYGDGGVDLLPLGKIYKTDVVRLARELGIPGGIIEKPPSAGLWEGQTDEGELGIPYEALDRALRAYEAGAPNGVPVAVMERVTGMVKASVHKRVLPRIFEGFEGAQV